MQAEAWKSRLLQEIIFHFGNDSEFIEDIFSSRKSEILDKEFSLSECLKIADKLGVSLQTLLDGGVNWKQVKSHYIQPSTALSDEYLAYGGTHMNSIRSIISFVGFKFNEETAQSILQELQISREVLLNDDLMVNVKLVNKLFKILIEKLDFKPADINMMSAIVHRFSMRNSVLAMAKSCQNDGDVLKVMVKNAERYELNFDYKLQQEEDKYILHSRSREELHDSLNIKEAMSDSVLLFKLSTIKNMTILMGRNPMQILSHETNYAKGFQNIKIIIQESRPLGSDFVLFQ